MSRWLQVGLALTLAVFGTALQSSSAVVRALLFYSPTCPHCHAVMTESLPPIMAHYQDQLQIVAIDTTTDVGQQLYQAAIQAMDIPEERRGVPTMIVGSTVMVGSYEIPAMLPNLVEAGLAQGGVSWPLIPGLDRVLSSEATVGGSPAPAAPSGWWAGFSQDISGNSLAALVLLGILATTAWALVRIRGARTAGRASGKGAFWNKWGFPLVAAAGAGISLYLAYVESTGAVAVCGPIGDCNAVQQSEYARLFGVVPIGVLGVVGYGLILAIHFYRRDLSGPAADRASLAIFALSLVGTAFSAYLTFLEIFVIGAVCAWCLSSAVMMAALLALSVPDARRSLARGRPRRSSA